MDRKDEQETSTRGKPTLPDLMRFKECASDANVNVNVKTITRWIKRGFLSEWRPHPGSQTKRIKREVWMAFKSHHQNNVLK